MIDYPDLEGSPWAYVVLRDRDDTRALIDRADLDWLSQWKWNVWWSGRRGSWQLYAKRNTGPRRDTVKMHREILILGEPMPASTLAELHGDHKNRQTLDNRRANLRWLTREANARHTGRRELIPSVQEIARCLLDEWRRTPEQLGALDLAATC